MNGGTCVNTQNGGFACLCASFYSGTTCQTCKENLIIFKPNFSFVLNKIENKKNKTIALATQIHVKMEAHVA